MKVGLSLSRCLRDIVEARVLFEDVLVVISRTDIDPDNDAHWKQIFDGYLYGGLSNPEWAGMENEEGNLRHVLQQLHTHGKLHQPRKFGAHPPRLEYHWLECVVPENEHNPAQQKAWDNYKLITDLA